jgi:CMP-N,N'-diacetyllegionaminic acid synthase
VVPARGGSKGVPGKNLRPLGGRPLLAWSVEAALAVPAIDRVIVSTDDDDIAAAGRQVGAEAYRRPAHLAGDTALVIDALRDLISTLKAEGEAADIMLLLEPTCPFRSPDDIAACIDLLVERDMDAVATFREAELNPHRAWTVTDGVPASFIPGADPWLPRQQLPPAYQLNGGVYCFRPGRMPASGSSLLFGRTGAIVMPAERSIDIDTAIDFLVAEQVLSDGGTLGNT